MTRGPSVRDLSPKREGHSVTEDQQLTDESVRIRHHLAKYEFWHIFDQNSEKNDDILKKEEGGHSVRNSQIVVVNY